MDPNALKVALGPAIVGILEALKQAGIPSKWAPLISMVLGAVGGPVIGLVYGSANLGLDALTGFGVGAAATGVYGLISAASPTVSVTPTVTAPLPFVLPSAPPVVLPSVATSLTPLPNAGTTP